MITHLVVVFEEVIGKSRGPKGFKRYKPVPYDNSNYNHVIVYAKMYTQPDIREELLRVRREMRAISEKNNDTYNVVEHCVIAQDILSESIHELSDEIPDFMPEKSIDIEWFHSNEMLDIEAMEPSQRAIFLIKHGSRAQKISAKEAIKDLL